MDIPNNEFNSEDLSFENRINLSELQESVFKIKQQLQKVIVGQPLFLMCKLHNLSLNKALFSRA